MRPLKIQLFQDQFRGDKQFLIDRKNKKEQNKNYLSHNKGLVSIRLARKQIPIYFLNTGFHFIETFRYKDQITKLLNLNTKSISSSINKNQQLTSSGHFSYVHDQDHCCFMNKVIPMESLLNKYDVWINGIRKNQSTERAKMNAEENASGHVIRYHPMLDWNEKMIWKYIYDNNIPFHPLDAEGYKSIGCEPCKSKSNIEIDRDKKRDGRWEGIEKRECGLHINLVVKE